MLVSSSFLHSAINNYKKNNIEHYTTLKAMGYGISGAVATFLLILAIIFFILEILLVYYAIIIAIRCTEPGPYRVIHILLALLFTIPYLLLNVLFNDCAKSTLKGGDLLLTNLQQGQVKYGFPTDGRTGCGCG